MIQHIEPVRDHTGQWYHPDLPQPDDVAEVMNQDTWDGFIEKHSISIDIIDAPPGQDISVWEPTHSEPEAVLLSITNTNKGPQAWFAVPALSWQDMGGA